MTSEFSSEPPRCPTRYEDFLSLKYTVQVSTAIYTRKKLAASWASFPWKVVICLLSKQTLLGINKNFNPSSRGYLPKCNKDSSHHHVPPVLPVVGCDTHSTGSLAAGPGTAADETK